MKLGAVTMAYQDEATIKGTLNCLKPFVEKHIVILADKPFFGAVEAQDKTEEICNDFGADVVKGFWENEENHRNLGTKLCGNVDWVLCFDSDEMITPESMDNFIKVLERIKEGAVGIEAKVYWHNLDWEMVPRPDHKLIVAVRPYVKFWTKRNVSCPFYVTGEFDGVTIHHVSWGSPHDIYKKVTTYCHANEYDGKAWYENHYKNWKPGDEVIQPFGTKWRAEYSPMPKELRDLL